VILVIVLLGVSAFAQGNTGRITGTVQDPSGAVVPNAKVTAVNITTQAAKETTSNEQGNYVLTAVQPGVYTVTVTAAGFNKAVTSNLSVEVAGTSEADFKMKVGSGSETVEVAANAVSVQTSESSTSRAITMKDIDTLPSLGRTPITLAVYQPGVQLEASDVSFSRINGQRGGSNNVTLDGIDVNDSVVPRLGLSMTANNTDSVGEFRIITQGAKAEYGRNAGGQVEMITRTGSNSFHGNGFDYLRNTVLNSNEYFNKQSQIRTGGPKANVPPKLIQNIFGGSFGGPIKHNKIFVFGNYQGRRARAEIVRLRTVYRPEVFLGGPSGSFIYQDSTGATRSFAIVDPRGKGFDPTVKALLALAPPPNNSDAGDGLNTGGFRFVSPNGSMEDQFTIKGDANITSKMALFLRWSWQRNNAIDSLNSAEAPFLNGQPQGTQGGHRWGNAMGHTWTLSNSMVNEFRYGHQSATAAFYRPERIAGPQVVTGLVTNPISTAFAQGRVSPVDDWIDNLTKTWHNHSFKFGGKYSHTQQQGYNFGGIYPNISLATGSGNTPLGPCVPGQSPVNSSGVTVCFNIPGGLLSSTASAQQSTYQTLYNNLLGRINNTGVTYYSADLATWQPAGSAKLRNHILNEHGYYFQDDWKVARNLTVNLGLRWELFLPPVEQNGIQATLDQAALIGPNYTSTNITILRSTSWFKTDWNNFAPRVGFAWDVKGDGKTAIRGNYGIFYDRMVGAAVSLDDNNTPGFSQSASVAPNAQATSAALAAIGCGSAPVGDVRISDCIPVPAQPAAPAVSPAVTYKPSSIVVFNPNLRTGYVHQYSLDIQRELFRNTILDIGYLGARGVKLFMNRDWNQAKTTGAFLAAFNELKALDASGTPVSAGNVLVKIYGSAAAATSAVTVSALRNNSVGLASDNVDAVNSGTAGWTKYAAAGLPATFLRNYPQFYEVIAGTNDGRSYYDALTISVRRYAGSFRVNANYTYSHSIDNIGGNGINQQTSSATDGNGFAIPIDNFNLLSNRSSGDSDHRHSFNASAIYAMPFGVGKRWGSGWNRIIDGIAGGWELGTLYVLQDGNLYTISSGRSTCSNLINCRADYSGSHSGSVKVNPDGTVFYYTAAQAAGFTTPAPGDIGNSGRNSFRGPGYFNIDASLVKHFKITERHVITFRAEAYNVLNRSNWTNPGVGVLTPATFGQIGGTRNPRQAQLTLRYDF
jgi:hypothetical protein